MKTIMKTTSKKITSPMRRPFANTFALALILTAVMIAMIAMMSACGNAPAQATGGEQPAATPAATASEPATTTDSGSGSELSGEVITAGSTSVQPLSDELAMYFMDMYPDVIVDVQGGGSGQGVKAVQEDLVDFGALSRELKDEEIAIITADYIIAKDGIAVVVNKGVDVDDLTVEQLKGIFTGEITNWSEIGGAGGKIEVVAREEGSGTRDAFNELTGVLGKDANGDNVDNTVESALIQGSTGAIVTTVGNTENSIGYISLGSLNDSVKALKVEGVAPSSATVLDGSYKVSRPFIYITAHSLSPAAQAFIDFVMGPEGQSIVEESGFIPVN